MSLLVLFRSKAKIELDPRDPGLAASAARPVQHLTLTPRSAAAGGNRTT